jgi:hypothetical protein
MDQLRESREVLESTSREIRQPLMEAGEAVRESKDTPAA